MSRVNLFITLLVAFVLLFLLQASGLVQFAGVRVNLLLAFFIFLVAMHLPVWEVSALLAILVGFVFIQIPFAGFEILVFSAIVLISFFVRRLLSGRVLVDFSLLLIFSTCMLFFTIPFLSHFAKEGISLSGITFPPYRTLFFEIAMNFLAGLFFILVGSSVSRTSRL